MTTAALLDFVRREGPVATRAVAYHFALPIGEARRRLKLLRAEGAVNRRRVGGGAHVWMTAA